MNSQLNAQRLEALSTDIARGKASGPVRPAEQVFSRLQSKYTNQHMASLSAEEQQRRSVALDKMAANARDLGLEY